MSETAPRHTRMIVPPIGHFLWIQNLDGSPQWFTQTEQGGTGMIVSLGAGQAVCYGPFERHVEFACPVSPAISMDALPEGSEPEGLADEPLRLKPLDPPAP